MTNIADRAAGAPHDWTERTLASGLKLCVDEEALLRVSDTEGWMFTTPLRDIRQVSWGPRSLNACGRYPTTTFPLNVSLFYGPSAYLSFVCAEEDLAAVRFIFDGRPLLDVGAQMRRLAGEL